MSFKILTHFKTYSLTKEILRNEVVTYYFTILFFFCAISSKFPLNLTLLISKILNNNKLKISHFLIHTKLF